MKEADKEEQQDVERSSGIEEYLGRAMGKLYMKRLGAFSVADKANPGLELFKTEMERTFKGDRSPITDRIDFAVLRSQAVACKAAGERPSRRTFSLVFVLAPTSPVDPSPISNGRSRQLWSFRPASL